MKPSIPVKKYELSVATIARRLLIKFGTRDYYKNLNLYELTEICLLGSKDIYLIGVNKSQSMDTHRGIKQLKPQFPNVQYWGLYYLYILYTIYNTIFFNDIVNNLTSNARLFADDISLYVLVNTPNEAAVKLNDDLLKFQSLSKQWLVTFNPLKTETLSISRKTNTPLHPPLHMQGHVISELQSHKHFLSNGRSWDNHFKYIKDKAWQRLNSM